MWEITQETDIELRVGDGKTNIIQMHYFNTNLLINFHQCNIQNTTEHCMHNMFEDGQNIIRTQGA